MCQKNLRKFQFVKVNKIKEVLNYKIMANRTKINHVRSYLRKFQ